MARRKKSRVVGQILVALFVVGLVGFHALRAYNEHKLLADKTAYAMTNEEQAVVVEAPKEVKIVKKNKYYDCPLSKGVQDHLIEVCEEEKIPVPLVLAIIEQESHFDAKVISRTNDYGLMQINVVNHAWLSEKYGITDFLDSKQNITAGVKFLSLIYHKYETLDDVLMAYNMGEGGARNAREQGVYSTPYSRSVIEKWEKYAK